MTKISERAMNFQNKKLPWSPLPSRASGPRRAGGPRAASAAQYSYQNCVLLTLERFDTPRGMEVERCSAYYLLHRRSSACSTGAARRPRSALLTCSRYYASDHHCVHPEMLLRIFRKRAALDRFPSSCSRACCRPANAIRLSGTEVCKCSGGRCESQHRLAYRTGKLNEI